MARVKPIRRLLIANRGEIAVRVARGARGAGIAPLGIYSEADAHAYHLDFMDDASCVGPAPASASYLDIGRVLGAALAMRADAVHPGYGFLSERAAFARAVRDAGLIFVGPTPEAIAAMGDKSEAKRRARAHDVPVVPGYDGEDQSRAAMRAQAESIGTPLLVKASAGGGGRGMRVVDDLAGFDEAFDAAKREALAAFGDESLLLERYVRRPRHIEFQILADHHGTTVHLGERECSIQRRHQKVIEEAPSRALDPALRERMGAAAVRSARSVGYTNAGTVEFLLDGDGAFYFLEMNARLQVEHPVTELVHGLDLVALQLAIASGEKLPFGQRDVEARGWAIEARVNAEDPSNGFLPAIGTIAHFEAPHGAGIRLDAGVAAGSEVSIYYDSMLAKLIAYGPSRDVAVERLGAALDAFTIEGVRTNLPLLRAIARDESFAAADTTTAYLTERDAALGAAMNALPEGALLLAVGAVLCDARAWREASVGIPVRLVAGDRTLALTGSRATAADTFRLEGDVQFEVVLERAGGGLVVQRDGERFGGRADVTSSGVTVRYDGRSYHFPFAPPPTLDAIVARSGGGMGAIVAPMPGKIVKVEVRAGDTVAERDLLCVLEAMKMEHRIEATRDGTIKSVAVTPGTIVPGGATLIEMEA